MPVPAADCRQSLPPEVAAKANAALQQTFNGGTTSSSRVGDGIPLIGKSGTTDGNVATWMSGGSTRVATVSGVFNVSGHENLRRLSLGDLRAASVRHEIWPRVMAVANAKYGGAEFASPPREREPDPEPTKRPDPAVPVPDPIPVPEPEPEPILPPVPEPSESPVG